MADALIVDGTNGNDTFNVDRVTGTISPDPLVSNLIPIQQVGVGILTLEGYAGDDIFNLNNSVGIAAYSRITFNGGDPSGSDIANITGDGTDMGVALGNPSLPPPANAFSGVTQIRFTPLAASWGSSTWTSLESGSCEINHTGRNVRPARLTR